MKAIITLFIKFYTKIKHRGCDNKLIKQYARFFLLAALQFIDFCTSTEGQTLIRDFGKDKYGEPLFFPNSTVGKSLAK